MKKLFATALAIGFLGVAAQTNAAILDFEDLAPYPYALISDGYHGFNWASGSGDIAVINGPAYLPGSGYDNGSVSGVNAAFNWYGASPSNIDLAGPGTFDFNGAFFTSAWDFQSVSFQGFNNSILIYNSAPYAINTVTPLWIGLNWTGIDQLTIANTGYQWVMDDFTYNTQNIPATPEPSTLLLLASGLGGLAFMRRFRKRESKS